MEFAKTIERASSPGLNRLNGKTCLPGCAVSFAERQDSPSYSPTSFSPFYRVFHLDSPGISPTHTKINLWVSGSKNQASFRQEKGKRAGGKGHLRGELRGRCEAHRALRSMRGIGSCVHGVQLTAFTVVHCFLSTVFYILSNFVCTVFIHRFIMVNAIFLFHSCRIFGVARLNSALYLAKSKKNDRSAVTRSFPATFQQFSYRLRSKANKEENGKEGKKGKRKKTPVESVSFQKKF